MIKIYIGIDVGAKFEEPAYIRLEEEEEEKRKKKKKKNAHNTSSQVLKL